MAIGRSLAAAALITACGGPKSPGAENVACFRANDCREGLVCVEGRCTSEIDAIVPEGAGAGAAGAGSMPPVGGSPDAGG